MSRSRKKKRKTKGFDRIVVCADNGSTPVIKYLSRPMSLLGITQKYQCNHVFLANKNLQQPSRNLRGWLCFTRNSVRLVLDSRGTTAATVQVLPTKVNPKNKAIETIDLLDLDGYFLQMLTSCPMMLPDGTHLTRLRGYHDHVGAREKSSNFLSSPNNNTKCIMDPSGPDLFTCPNYGSLRHFLGDDDFIAIDQQMSKAGGHASDLDCAENEPKSTTGEQINKCFISVPVIYVLENGKLTQSHQKETYRLPIGCVSWINDL
jgi:hypothetical protein